MRISAFYLLAAAAAVLFFSVMNASAQGAHYTYPFELVCPDTALRAGEAADISVDLKGYDGSRFRPGYNWTVSDGEIVSGQGTQKVTVRPATSGSNLVVTLNREFAEAHFPGVQTTGSCSINVIEKVEAKLTDEFGTFGSNCEEAFARLDSFYLELQNDPNARGYVIIYADPRSRAAQAARRVQILNHVMLRRFDGSRITIVEGPVRTNARVQFWLVPAGSSDPGILPADAVYDRPAPKLDRSKPYIHSSEFSDGIPGCGGVLFDVPDYARTLKGLAGSRGRVVIGEASAAAFRAKSREISSQLRSAGIELSRVTFVFKRVRRNSLAEFAELWVVPGKSGRK